MAGIGLVQRSITSRPTVTTRQLATEDSLPINTGTGGLEEQKADLQSMLPQDDYKEMDHKGLLRPHRSPLPGNTSHS